MTDKAQTGYENGELFRLAFQTNPDPVAISRVSDGTYADVNDGFCKVLGYRREEILGKTATELGVWLNPEDRERFVQALRSSGSCDDLRARFRAKDGHVVWGLLSARIFQLDGQAYSLSVTRDITKQVEMEMEQRALASANRAVLENEKMEDAMDAVLELAKGVVHCQVGFILDRQDDDEDHIKFVDSNGEAFSVDLTFCQKVLELRDRVYAQKKPLFENELLCSGSDGQQWRLFNIMIVPIGTEDKVTGVFSLGNKIHGFDDHDVKLCSAFAQICALAMDRQRLLHKMALSDRLASTGMLAAGVAHEINNPLTFVLYHLDALEKELFSMTRKPVEKEKDLSMDENPDIPMPNPVALERLADMAHDARVGTKRIQEISKSLSTFSMVDFKKKSPVDLVRAVEHAVTLVYNQIKYRARIVKEFQQLPLVMASEGHLSQVVVNLLVNAAQAIDEGDVEHNEIKIRTWTENYHVFLEVSDTGKGISPRDRLRIFEPFYTTKPIGVGSGLGLSICRNIITGYGGEISVSSKEGKGTSFLVSLPCRNIDAEHSGSSGLSEKLDDSVRGRVLVVDDEQQVRSIMSRILSRYHAVEIASSGAQALELLKKDQNFDVVLCDMMMPSVSGMDIHEWLSSEYPDLAKRMVFVTGGAFAPDAREYLERVETRQLSKPFSSKDLLTMVSSVIGSSSGGLF